MNMKREKRGLFILIGLLIGISLLLSSCGLFPDRTDPSRQFGNFEDNKYYQGTRGVEMLLVPGMPSHRMYYYGDTYNNEFDVNVEVANVGSSWSRGALYLSGYDPTMIDVVGINPGRTSGRACIVDIGNIGFGTFGGTLRCDDFFIGIGEGGIIDVFVNNLFGSGGLYDGTFDLTRLLGGGGGVDFGYSRDSADNERWTIGFDNPNIDIEYANHGRLLIALFQGLDFGRGFGFEYLLAGDTYEFPGGEIAYINFDGNIINWPPGLDQTYQTFMITNCFLYASYAAPVVCIDPAPFSQDKKVCTPRHFTGTKGQGAPVAITLIEQENTPRQAIFRIHVKNVGGGQVYDPGKLEMCSPYFPGRVTNQDLNIVYIGDVRVSGDLQRLRCTPDDFLRLNPRTQEGIITCMYDIPFSGLRSAYRTPLVVELWYGYSKTIEKRVLIKRAI